MILFRYRIMAFMAFILVILTIIEFALDSASPYSGEYSNQVSNDELLYSTLVSIELKDEYLEIKQENAFFAMLDIFVDKFSKIAGIDVGKIFDAIMAKLPFSQLFFLIILIFGTRIFLKNVPVIKDSLSDRGKFILIDLVSLIVVFLWAQGLFMDTASSYRNATKILHIEEETPEMIMSKLTYSLIPMEELDGNLSLEGILNKSKKYGENLYFKNKPLVEVKKSLFGKPTVIVYIGANLQPLNSIGPPMDLCKYMKQSKDIDPVLVKKQLQENADALRKLAMEIEYPKRGYYPAYVNALNTTYSASLLSTN